MESPDEYWYVSAWESGRPSSLQCSHVECWHGSSSGSLTEKLSWCGKTNRTSRPQILTAGAGGFWTARGLVNDESMSQTFKWLSSSTTRDNHQMIPQCTVCCLGSLGEKINMQHILYGQDKQLWFTYKHLLCVQRPGEVITSLLNKKINIGGWTQLTE